MRKSHIFLMIAAWFGLATYIALNETAEETGEEQATGLNQKIQAVGQKIQAQDERIDQKIQAVGQKIQAQDERIEKLQVKIIEIEKLLAARQQAPPPKPSNTANPELQEHFNATQELHVAEDAALPHVPHPTEEHLQTIRRLHEVRHKTDQSHIHPPVHVH